MASLNEKLLPPERESTALTADTDLAKLMHAILGDAADVRVALGSAQRSSPAPLPTLEPEPAASSIDASVPLAETVDEWDPSVELAQDVEPLWPEFGAESATRRGAHGVFTPARIGIAGAALVALWWLGRLVLGAGTAGAPVAASAPVVASAPAADGAAAPAPAALVVGPTQGPTVVPSPAEAVRTAPPAAVAAAPARSENSRIRASSTPRSPSPTASRPGVAPLAAARPAPPSAPPAATPARAVVASVPAPPTSASATAASSAAVPTPASAATAPGPEPARPAIPVTETSSATVPSPAAPASAPAADPSPVAPAPTAAAPPVGETRAARILARPQTMRAAAAGGRAVSGVVTVQVSLDAAGKVTAVQSLSGPMALRGSAEDAARRTLFAPALRMGVATPSVITVAYTFSPPAR